MLEIFGGLAAITVLGLIFSRNRDSAEVKIVKAAARGEPVNLDELATAYWKLSNATYKRNSEWIMLAREEKAAVFAVREELEDYLNSFPSDTRRHVKMRRPQRNQL